MINLKRAIIVLNGNLSKDLEAYKKRLNDNTLIISCNGGYFNSVKLNIKPDLIIGDLDSINHIKFENKITFPKEKDKSDSELAVDYLIERGFKEIEFWGAIGDRIDHTLFNISLLVKIYKEGCRGLIFHPPFYIFLIDKSYKFQKKEKGIISFYPITFEIKNLKIKNFKYELNGKNINLGSSETLSNEFIGKEGEVYFDYGLILVISESL
ncbi:MAG: thiamine diphosphokinase [Caldisericia bacterium]|nr:thiamine diphosphokinase [Caldisericia bacterium]